MDELETINNHLRMQAGPDTDVIVGMGYDATLDRKIGITLIATGFEHKDPFAKPVAVKKVEPQPEKIMMLLETETPKAAVIQPAMQEILSVIQEEKDLLAPSLEEREPLEKMLTVFNRPEFLSGNVQVYEEVQEEKESMVLQFELNPELTQEVRVQEPVAEVQVPKTAMEELMNFEVTEKAGAPVSMLNSFLSKPSNIYAEPEMTVQQVASPVMERKQPELQPQAIPKREEEMQVIMKEETAPVPQPEIQAGFQDDFMDEAEEQKRRAAERIQKLRNLSFNMNNSADANNEFDAVPAYVRRNMELFGNTLTSVENFYSKYTVGKDDKDQAQISTINTFLDGKKPD
jgi:cell division protein FtsZ